MAMADTPATENVAEGPASHRDLGNAAFKQGKLEKAIAEYTKAFKTREEGFQLALSNRAICHLKLGEIREAIDTSDLCLQQADAPPKVHLTKFKALVTKLDWLEAFNCLRHLRSLPNLPEDVVAAAKIEEKAKRKERIILCKGNKVGPDEAFEDDILKVRVNCDDDPNAHDEPHLMQSSLPATVGLVVPEGMKCETIDVIGARNEDPFAFAVGSFLAPDTTFRLVGPEVRGEPGKEQVQEVMGGRWIRAVSHRGMYHELGKELAEVPDLAIIASINLDSALADWVPTIHRLVRQEVLTVVTGYSRDQSSVQNEDVLSALGCRVVAGTRRSPHNFRHGAMCKNYHVLAFRGGTVSPDFDLASVKQGLIDRGFDIE